MQLTALELFSGAGGMSVGLKEAGFDIVRAIDNDPLAIAAYRANHPDVSVLEADLGKLDPIMFMMETGVGPGELDLLAGCPPCQGFSTIRTRRQGTSVPDGRNRLVSRFGLWAEALQPRSLILENVPGLADDIRLARLVKRLERLEYIVTHGVLNAVDYGVPQRRARFVLLAMQKRQVPFASPEIGWRTVRQTIAALPSPGDSGDPLHDHGESRSAAITERIAAIPPEGSLRAMGDEYQLDCHLRTNGFRDIYGRMAWDKPAPTITGGCVNPSKGRFLHPEQNRAITLREAALLQSFPPEYRLPLDRGKYRTAQLIGNALPPVFVARHAARVAASLRQPRRRVVRQAA